MNKNIIFTVLAAIIVLGGLLYGIPKYQVWQQGLKGQAELARAEQNRKIAVQEAEAKKDSARALAEAEVIRAEGIARANRIIGDSLKENESYLRYLWIQALTENQQDVIYVPIEAGLPILEAGKRR